MKSRLLSVTSTVDMLFGSVPVPAFAQGASGTALERVGRSCASRYAATGFTPERPIIAMGASACAADLGPSLQKHSKYFMGVSPITG